jgi:cell division protein FtsQ
MYKWMRTVSIILPLLIIVVGLGILVVWSGNSDRFPLRMVEVRGQLKQLKENEIKAAVLPFLAQGFFALPVWSIRDELQHLPWVQSVSIRRIWPDKLIISVQEQVAQARWKDKGILSTEGKIFYPVSLAMSSGLPQFEGPPERAKEMQQQYLALLEVLRPVGLMVQKLSLSPNGVWQMMLDNGMTLILGKTGLSERMNRFVLAYPSNLRGQNQRIAYVDLRYTNGFAIGWKTGVQ